MPGDVCFVPADSSPLPEGEVADPGLPREAGEGEGDQGPSLALAASRPLSFQGEGS